MTSLKSLRSLAEKAVKGLEQENEMDFGIYEDLARAALVAADRLDALENVAEAAEQVYLAENDITAPDYELNRAVSYLGECIKSLPREEKQ